METNYKNYISNGLFLLLKNNNLNNITITNLAKTINISRTTFYNNFKNINDVINYKLELIIEDLYKIYNLNKLRKNNTNELLKQILIYIKNNKNIFIIIKTKLFFKFKNELDNYFIKKNITLNNYIKISGVIINTAIYYLDNNIDINILITKIKID